MDWKAKFSKPDVEFRPEVRWWLAEGFHTDQTLKNDISMIYDSGFGAVEFLAMDEPGADSSLYGWGSEEWVHDSHTVMREATDRNMGVSMTSGTNWSNANLITITPDDKAAAKELDFTSQVLEPGERRTGPLEMCALTRPNVHCQELLAVVAARRISPKDAGPETASPAEGTSPRQILLDKDSCLVLTSQVQEGCLDWTAPTDGEYELFAFWLHGTGQTASPAVRTSYTINYIDRYGVEAFIDYWNREVITEEMKESIARNSRVQMYMDSLELSTYGKGGQFWGYHLLEEFRQRRGYDLTPWLPFVLKAAGSMEVEYFYYYTCSDKVFLDKLHHDLYQTMTDLYMENMLKPMQEWLHSIGMTLRAEISYGLPFEISQPGKYVDGIETESLEFCSQIESFRNLAGPAHLYRRLYSSETGATQLNYMMGLDFYTQIIYTQFAAGVSRTVLHGYSSIAGSEDSTYWPGHEGMWPIFSERFGVRQPAWAHYNDWTDMIARYQMLLRQGKPRVDLGILRIDYNFNNLIFGDLSSSEKEFYEHEGMRANEGIYWKDMRLQNMGYTYDYFAPQILEDGHIEYRDGLVDPEGPGYQALIIYQEFFPLSTARLLLSWAKAGLPLLFVNGVNETIRPHGISRLHEKAASRTLGLDGKDEELQDIIRQIKALPNVKEVEDQSQTLEALQALGISPRAGFSQENTDILTNLRDDGSCQYLFVYNYMYQKDAPVSVTVSLPGTGTPYLADCWTGEIRQIACFEQDETHTRIPLVLKPGQAAMVILDSTQPAPLHAVRAEGGIPVYKDGTLSWLAEKSQPVQIQLSDGTSRSLDARVPGEILLNRWDLTVEDWNEGEKVTITEDRGLGIVTNEVYYETRKDRISVGETDLIPWRQIPSVGPDVSGVGFYTVHTRFSQEWIENCRTVLELDSVCGNLAAVFVNGKKAAPLDFDLLKLDITDLVHAGENTITVEVSSTLNNRLIARDYYRLAGERTAQMANNFDPDAVTASITASTQDYGLVGKAKLTARRIYPL